MFFLAVIAYNINALMKMQLYVTCVHSEINIFNDIPKAL